MRLTLIYCRFQWPRGLGEGLWSIACWDFGFESYRGLRCLSLVNVVWYPRLADHPSREVLPTVVYHSVWSRNLKTEEALASVGLLREKKITSYVYSRPWRCPASFWLQPPLIRRRTSLQHMNITWRTGHMYGKQQSLIMVFWVINCCVYSLTFRKACWFQLLGRWKSSLAQMMEATGVPKRRPINTARRLITKNEN